MATFRKTKTVFTRLAHSCHIGNAGPRATNIAQYEAQPATNTGVRSIAGTKAITTRVQSDFTDDWSMYTDGDSWRPRRTQHAQ